MNAGVYERFWAKVDCDGPLRTGMKSRCWQWTAAETHGYGRFGNWDDRSRSQLAHLMGPIPVGMTVDHACENELCVNPEHFEIVLNGVNALRGSGPAALNARKVQCAAGHDLTGDNLYLHRGRWQCKACRRAAFLAFKERQATA